MFEEVQQTKVSDSWLILGEYTICERIQETDSDSTSSRMNVALTRARSSIWILGDSNKLRSNQYWSNLVGDAETRGLFRNVRSASSPALLVDQMLTSISVSHRSISTLSDPATRRHRQSLVLFPSSSRKHEQSRCHQLTDQTLLILYDPPIQLLQTESH